MTMERKIGEIFEYNGEWYQCIVGNGCENCAFNERKCYTVVDNGDPIGDCCADRRKDNKDAIFKKLEKAGEPFTIVGKLYQHYKVFDIDNVCGDGFRCVRNYKAKTLTIEIKQTKEDMEDLDKIKVRDYTKVEELNVMEEKKVKLDKLVTDYTSNKITYNEFEKAVKELYADKEEGKPSLKSFSLEAAKQGKTVCTRDGRKARIICFDRRLFYKNVSYPILALVERSDGEDDVCGYNEKGKVLIEDGAEYKDDLMMLPEKKEGWVNVYKERCYESKEEAIRHIAPGTHYIDTIRVEWEDKE